MGNPITNNLPPDIDNFLQDIAQIFGTITYTDVIKYSEKATKQSMKQLRYYNIELAGEQWEGPKADKIAERVAEIIKR